MDRYLDVTSSAKDTVAQATGTLVKFVLAKAGVKKAEGEPFGRSIVRAVRAFYDSRGGTIDEGVSPEMGEAAVELAERIAESADFASVDGAPALSQRRRPPPPSSAIPLFWSSEALDSSGRRWSGDSSSRAMAFGCSHGARAARPTWRRSASSSSKGIF